MENSALQRIHNPRNRPCGCDPDCWCRRTVFGRAVKWWVPDRLIGLRHKNDAVAGVGTGPRPRLVAGFGDPRMDHSW